MDAEHLESLRLLLKARLAERDRVESAPVRLLVTQSLFSLNLFFHSQNNAFTTHHHRL